MYAEVFECCTYILVLLQKKYTFEDAARSAASRAVREKPVYTPSAVSLLHTRRVCKLEKKDRFSSSMTISLLSSGGTIGF